MLRAHSNTFKQFLIEELPPGSGLNRALQGVCVRHWNVHKPFPVPTCLIEDNPEKSFCTSFKQWLNSIHASDVCASFQRLLGLVKECKLQEFVKQFLKSNNSAVAKFYETVPAFVSKEDSPALVEDMEDEDEEEDVPLENFKRQKP